MQSFGHHMLLETSFNKRLHQRQISYICSSRNTQITESLEDTGLDFFLRSGY